LWLLKCGLRAPEIVKIGNFSYKFAKIWVYPLKQFLKKIGLREGVPGTHPHAKFYRFGFTNVGLQVAARKIAKIGNFWYIFASKGYIPFINFYKIWHGGGSPKSPQSRQLSPSWL